MNFVSTSGGATSGWHRPRHRGRPWFFVAVLALVVGACAAGSESSGDGGQGLSPDELAFDAGAVALCNDGGYSDNIDFGATCSGGDGIDKWLGEFGRCNDGRIVALAEDASCDDNDGFDAVMAAGFTPSTQDGDVALCVDGTFSDNTSFRATCSSAGGVDRWLATYGTCTDGSVIVMANDARCDEGFDELIPNDVELTAGAGDVARCANGIYSDNTNFSATCSGNDGVEAWLAGYVECANGDIVELNRDTDCDIVALRPDYTPATTTLPPATTTTVPAAESIAPADALVALDALKVSEPDPAREPYERDRYDGDGWADTDGDCLSTRHELLIDYSTTPAVLTADGCAVNSGTWIDPYDGETYTSADQVSIDHLVALAEAHRAGAWKWDDATKNQFSNDQEPGHLVVIGRNANQSKADKRPDQWLPPDPAAHCQYATDWTETKARYNLTITAAEQTALRTALGTCTPGSVLRPFIETPPPVVVITTPTTTTTTTIAPAAGPGILALLACNKRAEEVTVGNTGGEPITLDGYRLHDDGDKHSVSLGQWGNLAPGQTLIITTGDTASSGDGQVVWKRQNVWNNDGDTAFLITPEGTQTSKEC